MSFYNIHTHRRTEGVVSILNTYPDEYNDDEQGFVSCGFHPWHVDGKETFDSLEYIVQQPNVVAIGETGFDVLKGPSMEIQRVSFEKHIELSERYEKPLIIHCVKAWDWLLASHRKCDPKQIWIIHGFRGKPELMKQLLDKKMKFSIGEKFNEETVKLVPSESLFCETDDSGLDIREIYKKIAQARNINLADLIEDVAKNVKSVFRL